MITENRNIPYFVLLQFMMKICNLYYCMLFRFIRFPLNNKKKLIKNKNIFIKIYIYTFKNKCYCTVYDYCSPFVFMMYIMCK